jgi:hypothetical protein
MTEFSLENHKMAKFSQGKRAVDRLDQRASAQSGRNSVGWSMQGRRDARAGAQAHVGSVGWSKCVYIYIRRGYSAPGCILCRGCT